MSLSSMTQQRVIPLIDARRHHGLPTPLQALPPDLDLLDRRARPLRDLRISVIDRCNFRCSYCMPKEVFGKQYNYLPHDALLSFEEITRLAALFASLGTRKIRLTGGEPLLRKNLEVLIEQLAKLRSTDGRALDLTLTTNASLLERKARLLRAAGLQRVTISLDALDDAIFRQMNDVDFPVAQVLRGIEAAQAAGLGPLKVNMVVKRGVNDQQVLPMARHFRNSGVVLRFIEYMDVGNSNGWRMAQVVPSAELRAQLSSHWEMQPLAPNVEGETASRWAYRDGAGEIGFISSVSQAFCGDCNRARLSTEGRLFLCLFASQGHDLRSLLRDGASDEHIRHTLAAIWQQREVRYSELRGQAATPSGNMPPRVEMSYIGG
jgi:cyclic pyranopterin phosphate synthase